MPPWTETRPLNGVPLTVPRTRARASPKTAPHVERHLDLPATIALHQVARNRSTITRLSRGRAAAVEASTSASGPPCARPRGCSRRTRTLRSARDGITYSHGRCLDSARRVVGLAALSRRHGLRDGGYVSKRGGRRSPPARRTSAEPFGEQSRDRPRAVGRVRDDRVGRLRPRVVDRTKGHARRPFPPGSPRRSTRRAKSRGRSAWFPHRSAARTISLTQSGETISPANSADHSARTSATVV